MYDSVTRVVEGKTYLVQWEYDHHCGCPWDECDGHGPVSEWETRAKKPGEWVLTKSMGASRFYDFQAAMKLAKKDRWNTKPYTWATKGQQAEAAVRADFEFLRRWCNDQWFYCGIVVTLLDDDEEKTDVSHSLWGIESDAQDYIETVINDLIDECGYEVHTKTYAGSTVGVAQ
jgi:hypothetical protein